ncbi:hypothetical protein M409DRAFT_26093 [Zasmidium cellare ATCC 36951]|uniref:Uncharacterized protein n=1 Tax=Zasmidium cellare ATCC 36951 TaxID=1080233 RepID=A0A6A6C8W6_ZASCE|nr:uncharacterized protein M409DRAFT_26093 [Zasmidium cellare ATCC 36951]KAF2163481.1 hypothetical protein M409DRAFT_26093 [Zasmidium cellare ATCC 36951]
MTGRAGNNPPPRSVSPLDPSLQSNPVPRIQDLPTRLVGPTAAPDAESTFTTARELRLAHQPPHDDIFQFILDLDKHQEDLCVPGRPEDYNRTDEEELALADAIRDQSWGFYVFVTDYDPNSQSRLPGALDKLTQCVQLSIQQYTSQGTSLLVTDEVWKRFRLDVVEDPDRLSGASLDRVRSIFIALVRARRPDFGDRDIPLPKGPRNRLCLVLDAETIHSLADLSVPETSSEELVEVYQSLDRPILKALDAEWGRPQDSDSPYRGWYSTSPVELHYLFQRVGWKGIHQLELLFEMESSRPHLR